ncbi:MAG: MFS transporter [SAR202 cluster bacterium]|nr:MFS transporter [SAR202 cluster bacterium]MDP6714156.1 MFS transporter [SAR202 cluster bacterium]
MNISFGSNYRWWAFAALSIGMFASVAHHGSTIVALPSISDSFKTDLPTTQWVLIGYSLTIAALLLPMGRMADIVGRKPVYIIGFSIFTVGGIWAGFASNIEILIVAKVFQGVGAAMTQGTSMAMMVSTFPPEERGKALGLQMSMVGLGGVAGPALGGLLIGLLNWQWVFFGSGILGGASVVAGLIVLDAKRVGQPSGDREAFDWLGAALSTTAMISFLMGMTGGPMIGWTNPLIVVALVGFFGLVAIFVWWELRAPSPMMDVRLFQRRLFTLGVSASYLSFLGMSSVRFLMPFYLQAVLGYSPGQVGLMIVPGAVMMIIMGPLSGRLSDRFGVRPFTVGGMVVSVSGLLLLSTLTPNSSYLLGVAGMVMQSFGTGTFNAPNNSAVLSAVEQSKYGVISGFLNLVRNSGNLTSVAVATAIVTATMASLGYAPSLAEVSADGDAGLIAAFTSGLRMAYRIMAVFVVVAIVASMFKGTPVEQEPVAESPELPTPERATA